MPDRKDERIDRRTVLKGIGIGAVGAGAATGVAGAHHPADIAVSNCPSQVVAGEEFSFDVKWTAGHASDATACFRAWLPDGTKVGETTQTGLDTGDTRTFTMTGAVPEPTSAGTYRLRVNASERYHRCPTANECSFPILCDDCQIEVIPPVEVADVSFRGCSEVWVAFDAFPVDSTSAQVNVNGSWRSITINRSELTKIPGQYGHDTPVFKYRVSGNDKLVGLKIVGETYTNDHRCAENV